MAYAQIAQMKKTMSGRERFITVPKNRNKNVGAEKNGQCPKFSAQKIWKVCEKFHIFGSLVYGSVFNAL
jgi:hypothetical protein